MKIAITGSRNWKNRKAIKLVIESFPDDTVWILGDAKGADTLAKEVCEERKLKFVVEEADWGKYGRSAGPIRNGVMLDHKPDLVIWFSKNLDKSKGTKNCVEQALKREIKVEPYFNWLDKEDFAELRSQPYDDI